MWRFDGFHPLSLMLVLHIQRSRWGKRHSSLGLHRVHTCPVSRLDGRQGQRRMVSLQNSQGNP